MTINTTIKNKPTLLLTGSEGNLAQWCIDKLKEHYHIVGVDHFGRYGRDDRLRDYDFVEIDLNRPEQLKEIFQQYQFDYVLHCAAQIYGIKGFHLYSADIINNNLVSTANLLHLSVEYKIKKFAFISSSMVYENSTVFPLKEEYTDIIPPPTTGYGLSKLVGERMLKEYHAQYGLKYVIWRPFNIVTPLERSDKEPGIAHVMADFIEKIIHQQQTPIEIFGDGEQTRCFTWIDDLAKIISNRSFDPVTDNQIYNVGSETPTKIVELAKMIHRASGRQDNFSPSFVDIYNDDVKYRVPDCTKAKLIGWEHTKSVQQLVDICIGNAS